MKTQEQKTEDALFELIRNAGNKLVVNFIENTNDTITMDNDRHSFVGSGAEIINSNQVHLHLFKPNNKADLDKWAEAIVRAIELMDEVEKKIAYDLTHPDFFRRIIFKHRYLSKKQLGLC